MTNQTRVVGSSFLLQTFTQPTEAMDHGLPLDLEREIFETAAIANSKLIPTLLLVCHRVHTWRVSELLQRASPRHKQFSLSPCICCRSQACRFPTKRRAPCPSP
ncbi:hypothetical protein B0H19DRAFT_5072 [Mycena capillaripes]|nr:hypothetical protein B0H19DRAFT_5072 [Mycena capillaripes]